MKEFRSELILNKPLNDAFEHVFNDIEVDRYMKQHNSFEATSWNAQGKRVVKFEMPAVHIPRALLKMVAGGAVRTTTLQEKKVFTDRIEVHNKVRAHVLGAELIGIQPKFTLAPIDATRSKLEVYCKMYAIMPTPLNHVLEGFMMNSAEINFNWFKEALLQP